MGTPKQEETSDLELTEALASAKGAWAIIRKGKRDKPPTVRRFTRQHPEDCARWSWVKLDVREGWAVLVDSSGTVIAQQSGPWGVRGRGRW